MQLPSGALRRRKLIPGPKSRTLIPHEVIAHYNLVSKLGEGGMGTVYRSWRSGSNRDTLTEYFRAALLHDAVQLIP
jgi:serine/threonine protein kinase